MGVRFESSASHVAELGSVGIRQMHEAARLSPSRPLPEGVGTLGGVVPRAMLEVVPRPSDYGHDGNYLHVTESGKLAMRSMRESGQTAASVISHMADLVQEHGPSTDASGHAALDNLVAHAQQVHDNAQAKYQTQKGGILDRVRSFFSKAYRERETTTSTALENLKQQVAQVKRANDNAERELSGMRRGGDAFEQQKPRVDRPLNGFADTEVDFNDTDAAIVQLEKQIAAEEVAKKPATTVAPRRPRLTEARSVQARKYLQVADQMKELQNLAAENARIGKALLVIVKRGQAATEQQKNAIPQLKARQQAIMARVQELRGQLPNAAQS